MRRRASRWSILILAALLSGASPADDVPAPPDAFDCADAFDLIAMTVMLRCATWSSPPDAEARIAAVRERLVATGLAEPQEFVGLRIAFCPLVQGTGMVPDPAHLYLDDGLLGMSVDGLAEIVAHELQHRAQFDSFGRRGFKCAYVRGMSACGGCQDRRHPFEAEAYARQDAARERLLTSPP